MAFQFKPKLTSAEFEAFIRLPENSAKTFELISGEVFEVPSNPKASYIAARILTFIGMYLLRHNIGYVTGADGGYVVGGNRYAPDVAYISYARQPELASSGYNPNPPELAVEVISNPDNAEENRTLRLKLTSYLAAGVVVWVVNAADRTVEVHEIGQSAQVLDAQHILTGGDILPDFELPIRDIFADVQPS